MSNTHAQLERKQQRAPLTKSRSEHEDGKTYNSSTLTNSSAYSAWHRKVRGRKKERHGERNQTQTPPPRSQAHANKPNASNQNASSEKRACIYNNTAQEKARRIFEAENRSAIKIKNKIIHEMKQNVAHICFQCYRKGHIARNCPVRAKDMKSVEKERDIQHEASETANSHPRDENIKCIIYEDEPHSAQDMRSSPLEAKNSTIQRKSSTNQEFGLFENEAVVAEATAISPMNYTEENIETLSTEVAQAKRLKLSEVLKPAQRNDQRTTNSVKQELSMRARRRVRRINKSKSSKHNRARCKYY